MSLKTKIIAITAIINIIFVCILFFSLRWIVLDTFSKLETNETEKNTIRVVNEILEKQIDLGKIAADWAEWDEAYEFILTHNQNYVTNNLDINAFVNQQLNFAIFIRNDGQVIHAETFDIVHNKKIPTSIDTLMYFKNNANKFLNINKGENLRGIIQVNGLPMMVSGRQITNARGTSEPGGVVLLGRYFDKLAIKDFEDNTQVNFDIFYIKDNNEELHDDIATMPKTQKEKNEMTNEDIINSDGQVMVRIHDDKIIHGFTILKDLDDNPFLILKTNIERNVYKRGLESINYFLYTLLAIITIFYLAILFLLNKMVLNRLYKLTGEIQNIDNSKDLSIRATVCGNDEISLLAKTINTLLDNLDKSQEQLEYISFHDMLTGLYNRNYFEKEISNIKTNTTSFISIVVCDVDGLKYINDNMGHSKGDELLKLSATIIKKCFRNEDKIFRIGGDEFVVLLETNSEEIVEKVCDRVRTNVDEYNQNNPDLPLSISIGYAINKDGSIGIEALFKQADDNMYHEKIENHKTKRQLVCPVDKKSNG